MDPTPIPSLPLFPTGLSLGIMRYQDADDTAGEVRACTELLDPRHSLCTHESAGKVEGVSLVTQSGKHPCGRWDPGWAPEDDRTWTDGSGVNGGSHGQGPIPAQK